jgi:hypothetical protein
MKRTIALSACVAFVSASFVSSALPVGAQEVAEPGSGVKFAAKMNDMSLVGVGLRKKVFFKVYAIGLYVSDQALAGPLAAHKGKAATPALYKELLTGDYSREVVLKFTRDIGKEKIQEAMREALPQADKAKTDTFVSYFPEVKVGQECALRWAGGGDLEVTMGGQPKPPIPGFAATVFGIWLGDKPIQENIKAGLVSMLK